MGWECSKNRKRVKKIPEGSVRRGRPILGWLEDIEEDLREMKVKR
jgi:hypothetical protein